MIRTHRIKIAPTHVELDGKKLTMYSNGGNLLKTLYRQYVNDYPKFFKMDELSRLGFIASELLLQKEAEEQGEDRETHLKMLTSDSCCPDLYIYNRAVIFFGHHGSLVSDEAYQATIQNSTDFYPSPAIFVYTLPNIVTGEIAIRNGYRGETSFILTDSDESINSHIDCVFAEGHCNSIIGGWLDYKDHEHFLADVSIWRID